MFAMKSPSLSESIIAKKAEKEKKKPRNRGFFDGD